MENERNYNTQEEPEEERKEEREDTNVSPSFSDAQPLADAMMTEDENENSDNTSTPEDSQEEPLEEEEGSLTEETSREPSGIRTEVSRKGLSTSDDEMVLERADEGLAVRLNKEGRQELDELLLSQEEREAQEAEKDASESLIDEDAEREKIDEFAEKDQKIKEQYRKAWKRQQQRQEDAWKQENRSAGIEEPSASAGQEENPYDARIRERYGEHSADGHSPGSPESQEAVTETESSSSSAAQAPGTGAPGQEPYGRTHPGTGIRTTETLRYEEPVDITKKTSIPVIEDAEAAMIPSAHAGGAYVPAGIPGQAGGTAYTQEGASGSVDSAAGLERNQKPDSYGYDERVRERYGDGYVNRQDRAPERPGAPSDNHISAGRAGSWEDRYGNVGRNQSRQTGRAAGGQGRVSSSSGIEEKKREDINTRTSASKFEQSYDDATAASKGRISAGTAGTSPGNKMSVAEAGRPNGTKLTASGPSGTKTGTKIPVAGAAGGKNGTKFTSGRPGVITQAGVNNGPTESQGAENISGKVSAKAAAGHGTGGKIVLHARDKADNVSGKTVLKAGKEHAEGAKVSLKGDVTGISTAARGKASGTAIGKDGGRFAGAPGVVVPGKNASKYLKEAAGKAAPVGKGIIVGKTAIGAAAARIAAKAGQAAGLEKKTNDSNDSNKARELDGGTFGTVKEYLADGSLAYGLRTEKPKNKAEIDKEHKVIRFAAGKRKEGEGTMSTSSSPKKTILSGNETKESSGIRTERGLNNVKDKKGSLSKSADTAKQSTGMIRRFMMQHGLGTGVSTAASAAQDAPSFPAAPGKLKIVVQALAKKAAAGILATTIAAGTVAGGAGLTGKVNSDAVDDLWTPIQAHETIDNTDTGKSMTQNAMEMMYARMQAYGVLTYYNGAANYSTGNSAAANTLVEYALSWVGKITYGFGAKGDLHDGGQSDCSWFVYHCLIDCGVIPKGHKFIHSYQWGSDQKCYSPGVNIGNDLSKAQPGDILCYAYGFPRKSSNSHVGIYIGNNEWVECSGHSGGVVRKKPSSHDLYQIVRFPGLSSAGTAQNTKAQQMIDYAKSWVGRLNYKSGGAKELKDGAATDCNLFVLAVLKHCGLIPKDRWINPYDWGENPSKYPEAVHVGTDISKAQPGDILVTGRSPRNQKGNSHVAIYIGNGKKVEVVPSGCRIKDAPKKVLQIVRFTAAGTAGAGAGAPQQGNTTNIEENKNSRHGFFPQTEAIVEAHLNDFNYETFDEFMASKGGAEQYVRSLGGVFTKWVGVQGNVQSAGEFQEIAEYVMGIMTIWGPDYHGGGGDHKFNGRWGKGDQNGRFYSGEVTHKWRKKPIEKVYFKDKEHIMTDCGCGAYYILQKAGLTGHYAGCDTVSEAWRRVDTSRGGTVVFRKEDLQVGDVIQMYHGDFHSSTHEGRDWGHVCIVGEVHPDGTVITYDTGNRFVNTANFKKKFIVKSDGSLGGDYHGYHTWYAMRHRALDQSNALSFNYISGPAAENLKDIKIHSVKVDGKSKNRNKFSFNSLGNYKHNGKSTVSVKKQFRFVDRNGNDITNTVLATGSTVDIEKAKKETKKIIDTAEKHLKAPFATGGSDWKTGVDATHFVSKVLAEAGVYKGGDKTLSGWKRVGEGIKDIEQAQAGDVIVYARHVAIYDGKGKIYECSAKTGGASHTRDVKAPGKILYIRRFTDPENGPAAANNNSGNTTSASGTESADDGSSPTTTSKGIIIKIPHGLGKTHTYMGWQCITSPSSNQFKLRKEAGMKFDREGFGVIKGRYVIACTQTYGNVGDCVDFYKKNGQVIHAVIGDIKSRGDAGCNKWGHHNGQNVIEFVVNKDTWYSGGKGSHVNPGNPSCHPEWNSETIKAVNLGDWKGNPPVLHPEMMDSGSSASDFSMGGDMSPEAPLYLATTILSMSATGSRVLEDPINVDQYDQYCFDVLDYAICEAYGADVEYVSMGDFYWCTATVLICCDPAKLEEHDKNFTTWEYKHIMGDPIVQSYMNLRRDVYSDIMNVDLYAFLAMNITPFTGNEEIVYEYLRSKGLNPGQIAGVMGNIKRESSFDPAAVNPSSGASGLCQWLGGRLDNLKKMAEARGTNWTDIYVQLDYLWEEMQGPGWSGAQYKDAFFRTEDPKEAATLFCTYFERPGGTTEPKIRAKYAEAYYNAIMSALQAAMGAGNNASTGNLDYVQWALNIAADNKHGYDQGPYGSAGPRISRDGKPDYDCSSLVYYALKASGFDVGGSAFNTWSMGDQLKKAGFTHSTFSSVSQLQVGDILVVNSGGRNHTEIYIGNGKNVGAHDDYDGKPGDSSGDEISVAGCPSYWDDVYRCPNAAAGGTGSASSVIALLEKWKANGGGHKQVVEAYNKFASQWNVSKMDSGDQWCSETASAAYAYLGLAGKIGGMSSNGGDYEKKAKKIGAWTDDKNYIPKAGDILITHDAGNDSSTGRHTAVVKSCDGKTVKYIAGGGSGIHNGSVKVGASKISGYVTPKWTVPGSSGPGTWTPPTSVATPENTTDPNAMDGPDTKWSVMIGRELHGDASRIMGKEKVVIDCQDYTAEEIRKLKEKAGCKIYSYLSIGSLEEYRTYYGKYKKYALKDYENWNDEQWVDVSKESWQKQMIKVADEQIRKGCDGFWLDNTDVYNYENYHNEKIYKGLLNIVTELNKRNVKIYINGGKEFVSRLIDEGKADLVDGVMQEEVYTKILEPYSANKFTRQDRGDRKDHEKYLDKCKKAGISASCLEYTKDEKLKQEIIKKCKERGYAYYISERTNLDK